MTDDIDWRGDYAEKELAVLKGQLQLFWQYIDSPVMWSYHILKPVRDEFEMRFGQHVK
jgi:hypothetical protein